MLTQIYVAIYNVTRAHWVNSNMESLLYHTRLQICGSLLQSVNLICSYLSKWYSIISFQFTKINFRHANLYKIFSMQYMLVCRFNCKCWINYGDAPWMLVDSSSGDGLLPDSTKPSHEEVLNKYPFFCPSEHISMKTYCVCVYIYIYIYIIWVRSRRCSCLVTWFCYHSKTR